MNSGKLRELGYDPNDIEVLSEYRIKSKSTYKEMMVRCPACGKEFSRCESRHMHIVTKHDPGDFGLPAANAPVATDGGERNE